MSTLVENCPRCGAGQSTFDMLAENFLTIAPGTWVYKYECYGVCRNCSRGTTFILEIFDYQNATAFRQEAKTWRSNVHLNDHFQVIGYVSVKDRLTHTPPDHIPEDISAIFQEGAACLSIECHNAAGAMFRLALDMATKTLLPAEGGEGGPNRNQRNRLFDRMAYLFDANLLPRALEDLAQCIREDGNDAAHDGTLAKADAEDLLDFSKVLLERIYTEPARLELARQRRMERRA